MDNLLIFFLHFKELTEWESLTGTKLGFGVGDRTK